MATRAIRNWLILAGVVVALVVVYAAVGFFGVPRLVRSQLLSFVSDHYQRQATLGEVRFNPFTFSLDMRDFAMPDGDGQRMLGFGRLHTKVGVATVWRAAPSLAVIDIEQPFVRTSIRKNGALNLADLARPFQTQTPPPAKEEKPTRLFIDRLRVTRGAVVFEDASRPTPFHAQLRPITFELVDLSTTAKTANTYALRAASNRGERFAWDGDFTIQPLASRGRFEVTELQASTVWSYLRDSLGFELPSGTIRLRGDYEFSGQNEVGLKLAVHEAAVGDLAVRAKGQANDYIEHANFRVEQARVDVARERVEVGKVRLDGATVRAWRDAQGKINLTELMATPPTAGAAQAANAAPIVASAPAAGDAQAANTSSAAGAAQAADAEPGADSAPSASTAPLPSPPPTRSSSPSSSAWVVAAPDIAAENLRVELEDRLVKPAAVFTLAPLDLTVRGYTTAPNTTLDITTKIGINASGHLTANAKVTPASGALAAHVDLSDFDLAALQPYVNTYTQISLLGGSLKSGLDIERAADGNLVLKGDTVVTKLRTIDNDLRQDFVKWDELRLAGLEYHSAPASLRIDTIDARAPYARLIIAPDQTLNITEAMTPTPGSARPSAVQTVQTSQGKRKAPGGNPGAMQLRIGTVRITNGSANFADFWIQPNYAVSIQGMKGSIVGLSSDPKSRARVSLDGKVDRYAPAKIGGEINLLSAALFTDMKVSFKGVDMTSVTPYSGRFAGYKIEKGKLSIDVAYHVENRKLAADQRFVIDQLQLGERVESPDAVRLPVRLAVALMKDRNGVIDIDLPMSGSLDDPQFRLGPLIWKAVVNLLTKAATAPFALLGSLFGGGPEMNQIDFDPGSARLDDAAQERIASLTKALQERPQLQLDIPVTYSPELDGSALAKQKLDATLQPSADPAQRFDVLMAQYKRDYGADAAMPTNVANVLAVPKKKRAPESLAAANEELAHALIEKQKPSDGDLEQLAQARARAVQDALLGSGEIDATRVFILGANPAQPTQGKIRLALSLK
jgi:hypothetical protein